MALRPRSPRPLRHPVQEDQDDWPVDPGRPLGLRLLALVGALAFVMLGINSLMPAFQPQPQRPALPSHAG